jgi:hypothetical protein
MSNENIPPVEEKIIYTEWVPAGKFMRYTILSVMILIISIGFVVTALKPIELSFIGIICGLVALIIFLFYRNFRGLDIILTNTLLDVKYGIFNQKKVPLNIIKSCEPTKARFRTFGGVGIRLGLNGSTAYNVDFGEALKLILKDGRPFVFSTRNSQEICKQINELTKNSS